MMLFFFFEMLSSCGCKQITSSSLFGMSVFLAFSLIQAAASCFALFEECRKREEYFLDMFQTSGQTTISSVKMQGRRVWFFVTMVTALSAAGILLLESVCLLLCCGGQSDNVKEEKNVAPAPEENPKTKDDPSTAISTSAETQKVSNSSRNLPPWAQP